MDEDFRPRAGAHYPRSAGEFRSWFGADADCLDYLEWLRWPAGFVCPECAHQGGWRVGDGRYKCSGCGKRTSVTAGTLFDRRRTPLTVWFEACWLFASGKDGMSALSLQRSLEIGSYVTAWAMLHRLRSVLVRPGRDRLTGTVEVDETYFGGEEPGLRGGRAKGKKVLVAVAVELREPRGFGRARMQVIPGASALTLGAFLTDNVEPGSRVVTDGWSGYRSIGKLGYVMSRAASVPPGSAAKTPASSCPRYTGSPRSPNAGCWAPTKARSKTSTCPVTSTSSSSGSTDAARSAAGCSATGSWNSPLPMPQCATATSSPIPSRSRCGHPRLAHVDTRPAWSGPGPTDRGGPELH